MASRSHISRHVANHPIHRHFIDTGAGVIDADYRGQVKILLFNHSDADFPVSEGDRVAQLVLERIYTPEVVEVAELEESVRGAGGFGSTGGFGEKLAAAAGAAKDAVVDAVAGATTEAPKENGSAEKQSTA